MSGQGVAVCGSELIDDFFEAWCALEVDEFAAFNTHKVVMMGFKGLCELVALFEADLNDIDDTKFREELERAVDAGPFGKFAGADDFLQRHGLTAFLEYRKYISAWFS